MTPEVPSQPFTGKPVVTIRLEAINDAAAIERLHERAFGPGRYARTAFRLREGLAVPAVAHCHAAWVGTLLVGSVRLSPVWAGAGQAAIAAWMLGPLTVDPAFERLGIGAALMQAALSGARAAGEQLVLLVGDEAYYRRFGFKIVPHKSLTLPGPVDPRRFLMLELDGSASKATGAVRARI